jgi:hypothetical protein
MLLISQQCFDLAPPPPPKKKNDTVGNKNYSDDVLGTDWYLAIITAYPHLSSLLNCLRCGPIAKAPYINPIFHGPGHMRPGFFECLQLKNLLSKKNLKKIVFLEKGFLYIFYFRTFPLQ